MLFRSEVYGFSAPSHEVSGSFFDAFALPNGHIGLLTGDAAGRGVSAALLMALGQTLARSLMEQGHTPSEAIERLTAMPFAAGLPNRALRMVAASFDPETGAVALCNAGAESPRLRRADGTLAPAGAVQETVWSGHQDFSGDSLSLESGDVLVFAGRGVLEAPNESGNAFSAERLATTIREVDDPRPTRLIRQVVRTVYDHVGDADPKEDITLLALMRS